MHLSSHKDPKKCLVAPEREKRQKYQKNCEEQHHAFLLFVVSVEGMLPPKTTNSLQLGAQLLSEKGYAPILRRLVM